MSSNIYEKGMAIAVRIRPLSKKEIECHHHSCCHVVNENIVVIKKDSCGGYLKSEQAILNEYMYDYVFDENSSQTDVFERTTKPFLPNLFEGLNVTVFCYGATGAGKTHTMLGNSRCDSAALHSDAGIIPNAVHEIFQILNAKNRIDELLLHEWTISVSFMEVYNEQVFDLLTPTGKVLQVREDQVKGVVQVAGLTEQKASTYDEVMSHLMNGNENRKTEATLANNVSSRSHAIFQLTLRHNYRNSSGKEILTESKLSLIDLAGSERASATNNRGVRLQEGANINKSLLALANCINALSGNGVAKKAVKYRDSKLTHLLKGSLEGNCNLVMIANINPSHLTYEDSHNTLKYSNRAKSLKVNATKKDDIKELSWFEREQRLLEENNSLRQKITELQAVIDELNRQLSVTRSKTTEGSSRRLSAYLIEEASDTNNDRVNQNRRATRSQSKQKLHHVHHTDDQNDEQHISCIDSDVSFTNHDFLSDSILANGLFDDTNDISFVNKSLHDDEIELDLIPDDFENKSKGKNSAVKGKKKRVSTIPKTRISLCPAKVNRRVKVGTTNNDSFTLSDPMEDHDNDQLDLEPKEKKSRKKSRRRSRGNSDIRRKSEKLESVSDDIAIDTLVQEGGQESSIQSSSLNAFIPPHRISMGTRSMNSRKKSIAEVSALLDALPITNKTKVLCVGENEKENLIDTRRNSIALATDSCSESCVSQTSGVVTRSKRQSILTTISESNFNNETNKMEITDQNDNELKHLSTSRKRTLKPVDENNVISTGTKTRRQSRIARLSIMHAYDL
jgi:kinesin family protein 18/19